MAKKKICDVRVFLITAPPKEAKKLARTLLEEHLIACAQLLPPMQSLYWWEGRICDSPEVLLVLKTTSAKSAALRERVKTLHSYQVPEILEISVTEACGEYEQWVSKSVT